MVPRDLATPITYNQLCQELRAQISTELKEYSEIIQSRDGISTFNTTDFKRKNQLY